MSNLINFQFKNTPVRAISINGEAWIIAQDVSDALGYADAKQLTRVLDADESALHTMQTSSKNGTEQARELLIINESGLYHALFKSRKAEAVTFRKWVTSEVLPSIRKTGTYTKPSEAATPEQSQHIKQLVNERVRATGKNYQTVWNEVFDAGGFNKLERLSDAAYHRAVAWFNGAPKQLPAQQNLAPLLKRGTRYLVSIDDETGKLNHKPIEHDAYVMTVDRFMATINEPGGIFVNTAKLADLAQACLKRLAVRCLHYETRARAH